MIAASGNERGLIAVTLCQFEAEHAAVEAECAFEVRDLGSLNGTYVNRRRIESHRLADGDEIQVVKYKLSYLER